MYPKNRFFSIFIVAIGIFLLTSSKANHWETSEMLTSDDRETLTWDAFDGSIPAEMDDWEIVADVSNQWFRCDYDFILRYTTLSVDEKNRIWIYGPDTWWGPNGEIVPDPPDCGVLIWPRIIRHDQATKQTEIVRVENLEEDAHLASARGWSHIGRERVLLTGVFIYASLWDGPKGGAGNKYIDFAILEGGNLRDLQGGNGFNYPFNYTIENNVLYAAPARSSDVIKILNLDTERWEESIQPPNCDNIESIEVTEDNFILVCITQRKSYYAQVYTKDMELIAEWRLDSEKFRDFPLAEDSQGRIWVGNRYILRLEDGEWILDEIASDVNMFYFGYIEPQRRTLFGMFPYQDKMLFNLFGAIYLADYDQKQWLSLIHKSPPLPMGVGPDGRIYAFTGKYIVSYELNE